MKNDNRKQNTIQKSSELSIKDFYCVFVRTEINLIAFSGPLNCVYTQYAALSGAMYGTGPGSDSQPLDLQSDLHLLPDTLQTALCDDSFLLLPV